MDNLTVASTEFQTRAGLYLERSAKNPVFITKHNRPVGVLLDIDEYERLKARDTRQAYYVEALAEDVIAAIAVAEYGPIDPALETLMD